MPEELLTEEEFLRMFNADEIGIAPEDLEEVRQPEGGYVFHLPDPEFAVWLKSRFLKAYGKDASVTTKGPVLLYSKSDGEVGAEYRIFVDGRRVGKYKVIGVGRPGVNDFTRIYEGEIPGFSGKDRNCRPTNIVKLTYANCRDREIHTEDWTVYSAEEQGRFLRQDRYFTIPFPDFGILKKPGGFDVL
ncbi:MAG: hypothetical protein HY518_02585 [Candidatus Aenigmarchaeota archaeon]|nr:hypothetical protein [Candidatus Aenigmarchaeota archaeon]